MEKPQFWTRDMVCILLAQLKSHKGLYDPCHIDYKNREQSEASMREIAEHLKSLNPCVNTDAVKRKIWSLKTQYRKQLRIIQKNKNNADPSLWCFNQLKFLEPCIKYETEARKATGVSIKYLSDEFDSSPDESTHSSSHGKRKKTTLVTLKEVQTDKNSRKNHWNWLDNLVVCQIKAIRDPTLREDTARGIKCLLREAMIKDALLTSRKMTI